MNPKPPSGPRRALPDGDAWPLFDVASARAVEAEALAQQPPHALMQRAGIAVARLALATAPQTRRVWVACGPGNNGGDGLVAATHLHRAGLSVHATLLGDAERLPDDARQALTTAQQTGVTVSPHWPDIEPDLAIDALLGLGASRAPQGPIAEAIARLNRRRATVLAVDLPSGLNADTGQCLGTESVRATHSLALLTLKPGLFTAAGRDAAGQVWLDDLGVAPGHEPPNAWLSGPALPTPRAHASHKGSYGDVTVVGGAAGMTGAALLAARAALAAGAGRVFVNLLDRDGPASDPLHPELMFRPHWWRSAPQVLARSTVVCGCGGADAVRERLPLLLSRCPRLVLDADALNALASDESLRGQLDARLPRGQHTVLTPHPLEAARLLHTDVADIQSGRLRHASALAQRHGCVVLLKGSGSIVAAPDGSLVVNPTGNALLASGGSGDVLAGWVGGLWTQRADTVDRGDAARQATLAAAWLHGDAADRVMAARPGSLAIPAGALSAGMRESAARCAATWPAAATGSG